MASILASGIAKIILGGSAVSLGAVGALSGLVFGDQPQETPKTELQTVSFEKEEAESVDEEELDTFEGEETSSSEETRASEEDVPESVSVEETPPPKKECRLHKLRSSDKGHFESVSKEVLKQEILKDGKGDYSQIETACDKEADKDIFVSNKNKSGWRYYEQDQNDRGLKGKFEKYLKVK
ncbi:hypothetical protein MHF_0686 [Mycoplasma haemofelis Ohio2]|uniref:Uncharacterized protein n=1 Tax=Mycoplasma haemofelis (strain Ohio2) TaxID=859194 RepID=F6FIA8_MYCHI|nr:hypothetical protein MHF_0686 [Mycoplasma haemofelis Ohio2]